MSEPVEVGRYPYRHLADMAAGLLEDAGIDAVVVADDIGGMYAGIAPSRVVVASGEADRAREILADFETGSEEE